MGNIPFLGLVEGTALGNGPNSDEAMEHDTQRKRVGQFEISFNMQVHSLKCAVPEFLYPFTHS